MTPDTMTTTEAAAYSGLHPATIKRHIRAGKLKAEITPRGYAIDAKDLMRLLDAGISLGGWHDQKRNQPKED